MCSSYGERCKYLHKCSKCAESHPVSSCPGHMVENEKRAVVLHPKLVPMIHMPCMIAAIAISYYRSIAV